MCCAVASDLVPLVDAMILHAALAALARRVEVEGGLDPIAVEDADQPFIKHSAIVIAEGNGVLFAVLK